MLKYAKFFGLFAIGSLLLTGCAYLHVPGVHNRDNDYWQSKTAPVLQRPADMPNAQFGEDYPVPAVVGNAPPAVPVSQIPPGSLASQENIVKR